MELLGLILALVEERGGRIVNLDTTVVARSPQIAPSREVMRAAIARALRMEVGQVSVKATTNEGLDSLGRGEGIAAWAVAMVEVPE